MNSKDIEKFSSAFTLSDMEVFIFPELFHALVLANILSPLIWKWRDDPWFKGIEKKPSMQRINRVKQYIMDNFVFNLDLETWGLTDKTVEMKRFADFIDEKALAESNALFGYEGDKYYFSMDIRKHFGLDKYTSNIIPYWKTETVEAMEAFNHKENYTTGAGECVSLSALYTAAIFIVARIPLEDIFLMATPLHSQNFIKVRKGVLTNNRRIVTKNMWFNGTPISTKARRALENEQVTIVSHISGYIHFLYDDATIDQKQYEIFRNELKDYLQADFSPEVLCNFLRRGNEYQKCFQFYTIKHGKEHYIRVERIYQYEHSSSNSFSTDSRAALLDEIDADEFSHIPIEGRIVLNDIEDYIRKHKVTSNKEIEEMIKKLMIKKCKVTDQMFKKLIPFISVIPKLPEENKNFINTDKLNISVEDSREDILNHIRDKAVSNHTAKAALYVFRDMERIDWMPFIKAAVERNPVSIEGLKNMKSAEQALKQINKMKDRSIYDGKRLALPDEVWNFQTGDGIEKAILLANILHSRFPEDKIKIEIKKRDVKLIFKKKAYDFKSNKGLEKELLITDKYPTHDTDIDFQS